MSDPGRKFQDEMRKLGLGVSITSGGKTVEVTSWRCPECSAKRDVSSENPKGVPCPECSSEMAAVLV